MKISQLTAVDDPRIFAMIFNVKLSRLLRKRALDSNVSASNRPTYSVQTRSTWRILFNAIIQTASPSLVVGYLVGFSYSASLSPTTLLAAVFVAFVASLLSGICFLWKLLEFCITVYFISD